MMFFEDVGLVRLDDPGYRAYSTRMAHGRRARAPYRPRRAPTSRDLFSKDAERTLRWFVNGQCRLSPSRVIRYVEHAGGYRNERFRELDLVAIDGDRVLIGEIKTTKSESTIMQGVEQLRIARELLTPLFTTVTTILLIVDTDDAPNSAVATALSHMKNLHLVGSLEELVAGGTHFMPFSVSDVERLAETDIHLDWRTAA